MQPTNRQTYIDWLRIAAIFGVLLFHSARPFMTDDPWHVNNATQSDVLSEFAFWLSRFRMHLLFFISGTVSWFMVTKKNAKGFMLLRFRRLFIPLLVGMLLIVPPQIYLERLNQGFKGNFWEFYPSIFKMNPYPKGNTSWHHLWFIAYLLVYDVVLTPFFAWAVSERARAFRDKLLFFARGKNIYLLMLPSAIWFSQTVLKYPMTGDLVHDRCFFVYWMLFVLIGFICMLQPALLDSLERNRRFSMGMALICLGFINYLRWNNVGLSNWAPDWEQHRLLSFLYLSKHPVNSWCWVFALVGYAKKYLHRKVKAMDYINQAIYPFYILHQTVIVMIAWYVVKTNDSIGMKYMFIAATSLLVSMGIYHVFIQPFALTRFLFGMRPKEKKAPVAAAEKPVLQKIPELAVQ
ncbi:MAG TPA: acyltransferase family protein [Chitinophaga sp.]|uniref:acyltransferase family protein n=1 Tax=Chitinophaga sp. TaxID=1869181 RepID=UPI002DBFBBA0|nr:acyltransferase family protein [Chitinophaga sp.]HEU4551521.1 acyltransferase family protein [Chitinophaga sp.]